MQDPLPPSSPNSAACLLTRLPKTRGTLSVSPNRTVQSQTGEETIRKGAREQEQANHGCYLKATGCSRSPLSKAPPALDPESIPSVSQRTWRGFRNLDSGNWVVLTRTQWGVDTGGQDFPYRYGRTWLFLSNLYWDQAGQETPAQS